MTICERESVKIMIFMPLLSIILSIIHSTYAENGGRLNETCNDERSKIMNKKKTTNHIHRCCNEIIMCSCMNMHCLNDTQSVYTDWCIQLKSSPCQISDDCQQSITYESCIKLPEKNIWPFILFIVLIVLVIISIIIFFVTIFYHKFYVSNPDPYLTTTSKSHQIEYKEEMMLIITSKPNLHTIRNNGKDNPSITDTKSKKPQHNSNNNKAKNMHDSDSNCKPEQESTIKLIKESIKNINNDLK
ncbi:uncharacterized protein LOC113793063 [Dermatophagoides pteronyssinus]|uniref:uncharacterized protein LOC113793063 n=1 Tax=Dermatophagoides pteronyssinus TaxID=6956 RepID=UPI003F67EF39